MTFRLQGYLKLLTNTTATCMATVTCLLFQVNRRHVTDGRTDGRRATLNAASRLDTAEPSAISRHHHHLVTCVHELTSYVRRLSQAIVQHEIIVNLHRHYINNSSYTLHVRSRTSDIRQTSYYSAVSVHVRL